MKFVRISIERPVAAAVGALMLMVLGAGAATRLPVREYPDVDPPIVSVAVVYPGASAEVVERDVTQVVEDNLNGIEGIEQIDSTSRAGFAQINVEFVLSRDLDAAAADIRDKVSAVRGDLPDEVEEPVISKASADALAMMWITLTSGSSDRRGLTDFAIRNMVDPLSVVGGVAQVIIGGERRYAMRIWLDADRLAARGVTVGDVASSLRRENLELPGGRIETGPRELTVRTDTKLAGVPDFRSLVLRDEAGYQVTLSDVARIELGAESYRSAVYRSGRPAVGLGIVRQSGSNTLAVAEEVRAELERLDPLIPADIDVTISYDQSVFIQGSIREVVKTLLITAALVIAVIYLFLGSLKSTLVPAATIPTSIIATFAVLYALGFSINTLTLLSLVLAIGLVVDDAIVVLENVVRYREKNQPKLIAAVHGASQVGLAVIATTAVLAAVLLPIAVLTGTIGRLFTEFAITLATAVIFSSFIALSLGAMLASKLAEPSTDAEDRRGPLRWFTLFLDWLEARYARIVDKLVRAGWIVVILAVALGGGAYLVLQQLPSELAPVEDRAVFIIPVAMPEGSSLAETTEVVKRIETILQSYFGTDGAIEDTFSIVGTGRRGPPQVTNALIIVKLKPWGERGRSQQDLVAEITPQILSIPGARAIPINPPSLVANSFGKPVQFVISGPDYEVAQRWAETVLARAQSLGTMNSLELEFNRQSPQATIMVDRRLAADLGLSVAEIGEALRIFLGGDDITEYYERGETYEVVVRGEVADRDEPSDIATLQLRSATGAFVPLASVVSIEEKGTAASYRRVDRQPSMVISAVPAPGADLGSVLTSLEEIVEAELPAEARINYLGLSKEFAESSSGLYIVFVLALVVVYLTLAALFGSFVYPAVILVAVPLAVTGGLLALLAAGMSFNTFSQIGLLLLVGLLAKNAILIVDFANERRRDGADLHDAVVEAASTRFRPILMTSIATLFGAIPLALATGPGSEAREVIGVVIIAGVVGATLITLFIVPGLYRLLAPLAGLPGGTAKALAEQERQ